jgi:hypothetical protein
MSPSAQPSIPLFDASIAAAQIHYLGWKSRHDEWVRDNRLVEDNDAGRRLQKSLIANGGVVIDDDHAGAAGAKDGDESEEEELPGIKLAVPNTVQAQNHQSHMPGILVCFILERKTAVFSFWTPGEQTTEIHHHCSSRSSCSTRMS